MESVRYTHWRTLRYACFRTAEPTGRSFHSLQEAALQGVRGANFRTCRWSTLACEVEGARFALSLDKIGCGSEISNLKQAWILIIQASVQHKN